MARLWTMRPSTASLPQIRPIRHAGFQCVLPARPPCSRTARGTVPVMHQREQRSCLAGLARCVQDETALVFDQRIDLVELEARERIVSHLRNAPPEDAPHSHIAVDGGREYRPRSEGKRRKSCPHAMERLGLLLSLRSGATSSRAFQLPGEGEGFRLRAHTQRATTLRLRRHDELASTANRAADAPLYSALLRSGKTTLPLVTGIKKAH